MENAMNTGKIEKRGTELIELTSRMTGREYKGEFTWRRRTLGDLGKIAETQSTMTSGVAIVDREIGALLRSFSELSVVLEKFPPWWEEVSELPDIGVILAVHIRYLRWVDAPFRTEREDREKRRTEEKRSDTDRSDSSEG